MPEILLFTKPDCQKCDYVKERIPDGLEVSLIDASTAEGMAEAAFYELMEKPTPILVVDDEPITGAINILNRLKEISDE
jgi:deoxyxylulose-5-phosphate synthase